eukprot:COSAG06_NODE_59744_length_273_cov_0.597701_1_plen_38_part_01
MHPPNDWSVQTDAAAFGVPFRQAPVGLAAVGPHIAGLF